MKKLMIALTLIIAAIGLAAGARAQGPVIFENVSQAGSIRQVRRPVFEVQGWSGNYANYVAALAAGAKCHSKRGIHQQHRQSECAATVPVETIGWDGNLVMVPEPSIIVLSGLGGTVFLLFCRRKEL